MCCRRDQMEMRGVQEIITANHSQIASQSYRFTSWSGYFWYGVQQHMTGHHQQHRGR
jgi:hypothetical protein